jgi:hypothetical protein
LRYDDKNVHTFTYIVNSTIKGFCVKRDVKTSFLPYLSLFLLFSTATIFSQDNPVTTSAPVQAPTVQEKTDQKKEAEQVQEFDVNEFFGDTGLNPGEKVRSAVKPLSPWQIYLASWGTWAMVKGYEAFLYTKAVMNSIRESMRRRATALIGLVYAQKKQQLRKA